MGLSVGLGLRYRLLWFWVFRWVFPMGLSVGLGLRYRLSWFWVFRWPRGWCMVRKWKWSLLSQPSVGLKVGECSLIVALQFQSFRGWVSLRRPGHA